MNINQKTRANNTPVVCTVVTTLPAQGLLMVVPTRQTFISTPFFVKCQTLTGNYGTSTYSLPVPGSQVLVSYDSTFEDIGHVLGVYPSTQEITNPYTISSIPGCTSFCYSLTDTYKQGQLAATKDHLYASSIRYDVTSPSYRNGAFPGDTCITDKNGGGLFVGRAQLKLFEGSTACITISGVNETITEMFQQKLEYSPVASSKHSNNLSWNLLAFSTKEGLGVAEDVQTIIDTTATAQQQGVQFTKAVFANEEYSPLYRLQHFSGIGILGQQFSVVATQSNKVFSIDSDFDVLLSQKTSYKGQRQLQATQAIRNVKTPFITAPQYCKQKKAAADRSNVKSSYKGIDEALKLNRLYSAQSFDPQLFQDYMFPVQLDPIFQQQHLYVDRTPKGVTAADKVLDAYYLSEVPSGSYTDSLTKETSTIFYNTSIMSQEPDGSIVIKDGWGSQIRMYGGNIYISPALDLFLRPGRDLIGIVPRQMDLQAYKHLSLASKKDIDIGAQQDMKLASGISGNSAVTVIQNRSNDSGSFIVRSQGTLDVVAGGDISVKIAEFLAGQDVIQEADSGQLRLQVPTVTVLAKTQMTAAANQMQLFTGYTGETGQQGSMLLFTQNSLLLNTANAVVTASVLIDSVQTTTNQFKISDSVYVTVNNSSSISVLVQGQLIVGKNIYSTSVTARNHIVADRFITITQTQEQIPVMYPKAGKQRDTYINSLQSTLSTRVNGTNATISLAVPTLFRYGTYQLLNQFKLKTFSGSLAMPGMCWQVDAEQKLGQPIRCLSLRGTDYATVVYPGQQAWRTGTISTGWDSQKDQILTVPMIDYPINTSNLTI